MSTTEARQIMPNQLKCSVYRTVRTCKNKPARECVNNVHLHFPVEPKGTILYIHKENDKVIISKHQKTENDVIRSVNCIKNTTNSKQLYLNFKGITENDTIYNVSEYDDSYVLTVSEETAPKKMSLKMKPYQLVNGSSFRIKTEHLKTIVDGFVDPVIIMEEFYRPHCFIKIYAMEREEAIDIPNKLPGSSLARKTDKSKTIRKGEITLSKTASRYFIKESAMDCFDTFNISMEGQILYLEAPMKCCDICNKKIRRRSETYKRFYLCENCDEAARMVKNTITTSGLKQAEILLKETLAELKTI